MGQQGFWDVDERQKKLSKKNPLLDRLNEVVPWKEFRPILERVHKKERKSNAGRKAYDVILMFKMLLLQKLYNISDEQIEYQVNDRLSFMLFLGLGIEDRVPDATTVWKFREQLIEHKLIRELFDKFESYLQREGFKAQEGQIVDATLVPVPIQRNSREDNEKIRNGEIPEKLKENPHRLSQKDLEARWTKKNGKSFFGYKNHISIDAKFKLVRKYKITDASVHDSKALGEVLDIENPSDKIWADSAYRSEDIEWTLEKIGFESEINERAYRNHPLSRVIALILYQMYLTKESVI